MAFSDKFEELMSQPVTPQPAISKNRDWGFTITPAPHDHLTADVTATTATRLDGESDWTDFVTANGGVVAPGYKVRLVEMRHNTAGWTRDAPGEDAVTRGTWFYRFAIEPINLRESFVEELLQVVNGRKKTSEKASGPSVFHFLAGDTQLGKVDGDGTEGIVKHIMQSTDIAVAEFKRLRKTRSIGTVHIAWLGDCLEGNQSQNGRNMWRTQLTVTEQFRLFRRIMLEVLDEFAPLVESVQVDVVNGNHDQVQRFQETRADDGHATEAALTVRDAIKLNADKYGHCEIFVPNKDEAYITREVGSSIITMTHGHQWPRNQGMKWWSGQSFNWQSAGAAQFLFHGHEHEFSINSNRDRVRICCPTFESESTWWRHKTGDVGKRGGLTLVTAGGEFTDLRIA